MNGYDLPTSLTIRGVEYRIRSGWRAVMDIFSALSDPEFDDEMKSMAMIRILYPDWRSIPFDALLEAAEKACDFLDCGYGSDKKAGPKTIDWTQDASLIVQAVNQSANVEIRENPDIHWWTFFGWFMSTEERLFSTVVNIRNKRASGKKLEKWEQEFLRKNRSLIEFQRVKTTQDREQDKEVKEYFAKWL